MEVDLSITKIEVPYGTGHTGGSYMLDIEFTIKSSTIKFATGEQLITITVDGVDNINDATRQAQEMLAVFAEGLAKASRDPVLLNLGQG